MALSTRFTRFSASQAVARARSWTSWQTGMCLNYVWNCLDVPNRAGLEDANQAWAAAAQKVFSGTPPAGAPIYWAGGRHGHIAMSLGGGRVRSTDWRTGYGFRAGSIGEATINDVTREFGLTYRGWSRDYATHPISGLQVKPPSATIPAPPKYNFGTSYVVDNEILRLGRSSSSARLYNARVWSWLYWMGGSSGRSFCVSYYKAWEAESASLFGATSVKATQAAYKALNTMQPKGGWGGSTSATYPGPALLRVLGLKAD